MSNAAVLDASYYVEDDAENNLVIEVPMRGTNEVVTVDLENELPEDPTDLCVLLENEEAESFYWLSIAAVYANKGLISESFEMIHKGLAIYTDQASAPFHTFLAWLHIRQSRNAKTIEEKNASLKLASESTRIALLHQSTNPLNRLAQAEIYYQQKNLDQALDVYDRILKVDAKSSSNVYALLGKAKVLFQKKSYSNSLKIFQQVLILNPVLKPDARIGIGLNFWKLKDKELAIKSWSRSLELDSNNQTAKLLLILAKFDSSFRSLTDDEFIANYSGALDSLKSFLSLDDKNPAAQLLLASFYYSKRQLNLSKQIAQAVLSNTTYPSNILSDANFWIARTEYEEGNFNEAQKYFSEALRLNPDNLLAKLGVGQSQYERSSVEDSIITFESIYKENQKILEVDYILGVLYSQHKKHREKAIAVFERYLRQATEKHEPIVLNVYYTLSRLFENKDNTQSLNYLSKAIELLKERGEKVPVEVLNNLGVFHFIKGNPESAKTFFESALNSNSNDEESVTLTYNIARSEENTNTDDAFAKYNSILEKTPDYIFSKIRILFLEVIKSDVKNDKELQKKVDDLLEKHPSDLEIRAFYSWYLKRANKGTNEKGENLESKHNKETLVKYDSHDTYALIALGNLYCAVAREVKGKSPQDIEKKNQSYVRGAQLFQKVLALDPNNVFAAQGIAIIFFENKQPNVALEIFRKVRDAIDDISVYINLGHCLIEVGQYSKAIESYEIVLRRYGDENKDSRFLTLVGRAWFARAVAEKSLESYSKALEYSVKALDVAIKMGLKKLINSLKFNIAFVQFNIAQFVQKMDISKRTVDDILDATTGLKEAITSLNALSEEKYPPYPAELLKQRASMGSNTLINQLERALNEQKEYAVKFEHKLKEAQAAREAERARSKIEEQKRKEEEAKKEAQYREEYLRLQEQAKEWEKEREAFVFEDEDKKKGKKSKNAIYTDDELSDEDDKIGKPKKGGKKTKRKKDENSNEPSEKEAKKRKISKKYKSQDIIEDSDEDLDDFDESKLDDDVDDDAGDDLEAIEAKIDAAENGHSLENGDDIASGKEDGTQAEDGEDDGDLF